MRVQMRNSLVRKVEGMKEEIVEFLRGMIRIPSENPPGNYEEIAEFVTNKMTKFGFKVEKVGKEGKPNVIGRLRGTEGKPVLILNGHLDTVPASAGDLEGWTVGPFSGEVREGRIYGRGAYDCKGRVAVYTMAAKAIKDSGIKLKGDVVVAATVDEETGGFDGAGYLVEHGLLKGDMAICEGPKNKMFRAGSGEMYMKISTIARTTPPYWATLKPQLSINAIQKMVKVIEALEKYQLELMEKKSHIPGIGGSTIVIGTIEGGIKSNIVPTKCTIQLDVITIPELKQEVIQRRIDEIMEDLERGDPELRVEIETLATCEPWVTPSDSHLVKILNNTIKEVTGQTVPVAGLHASADSRWWARAGMQAVNFGAGDYEECKPHQPNENVKIQDLVLGTKIIALTIVDLLGCE